MHSLRVAKISQDGLVLDVSPGLIAMDDYGKRALDFVEDLQQLTAYDDICRRIMAEMEWFGFTHVTVWSLPGPGVDVHDLILLNTRPTDYNEHYERKNYIVKDPMLLKLRQTVSPFTWDDVRAQHLSRSARNIIEEAREFDARDGLIVPIRTISGSLALFSPCGRNPNLEPRAKAALEMIGIYANQALERATARIKREAAPRTPLTVRERETMKWVATGKTDDEIASILSISRETVTTHVESAKRKLDATRRTYAVVQALRYGEITL